MLMMMSALVMISPDRLHINIFLFSITLYYLATNYIPSKLHFETY